MKKLSIYAGLMALSIGTAAALYAAPDGRADQDGDRIITKAEAMAAADAVLVPLQAEFYALEGLSQLMLTVRKIRTTANPGLRIEGVVMTMVDSRNRLSQQVESDARATLGDLVFKTVIPRNVRLSEAPSFALPVMQYDPSSKGTEAYRALSAEIMARHPRQRR